MGYRDMDNGAHGVMITGGMGHMDNGTHGLWGTGYGQWGTGVWVHEQWGTGVWGTWAMGHRGAMVYSGIGQWGIVGNWVQGL